MTNFIYCIECKELNKVYIGSTTNLKRRYFEHFSQLKDKKHCNIGLQNAYNKNYKLNFYVLEIIKNKHFLLKREQFYINKNIDKCFNLVTVWGEKIENYKPRFKRMQKRKMELYSKNFNNKNKKHQKLEKINISAETLAKLRDRNKEPKTNELQKR